MLPNTTRNNMLRYPHLVSNRSWERNTDPCGTKDIPPQSDIIPPQISFTRKIKNNQPFICVGPWIPQKCVSYAPVNFSLKICNS